MQRCETWTKLQIWRFFIRMAFKNIYLRIQYLSINRLSTVQCQNVNVFFTQILFSHFLETHEDSIVEKSLISSNILELFLSNRTLTLSSITTCSLGDFHLMMHLNQMIWWSIIEHSGPRALKSLNFFAVLEFSRSNWRLSDKWKNFDWWASINLDGFH